MMKQIQAVTKKKVLLQNESAKRGLRTKDSLEAKYLY
jgi:hypothetical protein